MGPVSSVVGDDDGGGVSVRKKQKEFISSGSTNAGN